MEYYVYSNHITCSAWRVQGPRVHFPELGDCRLGSVNADPH